MKVNGSGANAGDILAQMRQAHEKAQVDGPSTASTEATGASQGTQGSDFQVTGQAEASATASEPSALDQEISSITGEVLAGKIDDPTKVREKVIDAIIEERFSSALPTDRRARKGTLETIRATLVDDPSFVAEIDNLLLHAAREFGP